MGEHVRNTQLGAVVRDRRRAAGFTLARLSADTGLSPSFLSQLENGHTNTSLRSLQQIADALSTTATALLAAADDTAPAPLVRADENTALAQSDPGAGTVRALVHGDRDLRALEFTGGTDRGDRDFTHRADEIIHVVRGRISLVADGTEYELGPGDTYYCRAGEKHRWWAHSPDTTTLVLAVADGRTVRRGPRT
ncbi:cupin domain-containing protein [Nocardia sp. AG03]|uniref:helix-turn-helix domain-containing protein n=1 Tax=Nocardia sp. AG03 TaxID=3025312 RepID=UPI00241858E2|nr:cupin domain-containing protein [Nocardia sp. AG03]